MGPHALWSLTKTIASEFWALVCTAFWEWWNDNTFRLSASLAFYTLFSLSPLILIAITLVGFFTGGRDAALQEIVDQTSALVGEQGGEAVAEVADAIEMPRRPIALVIALVTFLVGSTVVFAELQAALNQIWDVQTDPDRGVIRDLISTRLRSFGIALGVGFLLLVSMLLSATLSGARAYFADRIGGLPWIWQALNLFVGFFLIALLFAMIYKFLPDVKIRWRDVAIGSVVTAILFSIGRFAIGTYLGQTAVGGAYGAAGSLVVLLIWVYYSALISFYGAEFTQVYARRFGSHIHPEEHAVRKGEKADEV